MLGQISRLVKRLVTLCALIWLFTCVSSEVLGQISRLVKRLVTLCALIWLFTCVSSEVLGQISRLVKRLVTLCTLIWLFTCVSSEVLGQSTRMVKHFAFFILIPRFAFLRVKFRVGNNNMTVQVFSLFVWLDSHVIFNRTYMCFEKAQRREFLAARITVPCSVDFSGQADTPVSLKKIVRSKHTLTDFTGELIT